MPAFSSKLVLSSAASASGIPLADVDAIRGAFKVYDTYEQMIAQPVSLISNNQIVWVQDAESLYKATVTYANPPFSFTDSVTWNEFNFPGGTGGVGDITAVIAGSGLTGTTFSGTATLNIGEGDGITVSADTVSINTGSAHFEDGVEKVVIVTTLDGGDI